jgi:hypothetical protein
MKPLDRWRDKEVWRVGGQGIKKLNVSLPRLELNRDYFK